MQTVTKGTGRPAAAARSAKHAQRTPLPPKAGSVAEAAQPFDGQPFGKMNMAELRAYAASIQVEQDLDSQKITTRTPRGKLLNAILAEQQKPKQADDADEERTETYVPEEERTTRFEGNPEAKGLSKAQKLAAEIQEFGWTVTVKAITETEVEAVAQRGAEILNVVWDTGVFLYEPSGHTIADRHTRVRNVSQAKQFATRPAEAAEKELTRVASNKAWKRKPVPRATTNRPLPFDGATVTEQELSKALRGRFVKWHNRLTESEESAYVSLNPRYFSLTEHEGERVVQFCGSNGFRAFRLAALIKIGKTSSQVA